MTRPVLIATIPRSGTWYSCLFFWTYNWLLERRYSHFFKNVRPEIIDEVLAGGRQDAYHTMSDMQDASGIGIKPLYVFHTMCPGYLEVEDPLRAEWDKLSFSLPYNSMARLEGDEAKLDPSQSPDARIVYLYRNPLDHFVSYFRVSQAHVWDVPRTREINGERVPLVDLQDFTFNGSALESYLKQFHTFKVMQRLYPENVLMLPYETFAGDPKLWFGRFLEHFGFPVRGWFARKAFETAFAMTTKEAVKGIERKMNRSLSGELRGNERHVADGATGQWVDRFSKAEIAVIEGEFNRLGYSLSDFQTR